MLMRISEYSSTSSPACPWWSGKTIINAGWALSPRAPRMGHVSLHLPEEPPLAAGGHQKSLNVQWKLLHMKLWSRYTWTHVFGHLSSIWKTEGWKMFWVFGGGKGREGTEVAAFPASQSLNQFSSRVKCLILSQELILMLLSYAEGASQAWQQTHVRQIVQYWIKSSIKPQQLWVL